MYSYLNPCFTYFLCFRNQSYHAHVQLAALDHNAHLDRQHLHNKDGDYIYSRKFCKKWDTTPTLKKKKYEYIPGLMDDIVSLWSNTSTRLKDRTVLEESHPKRQQATIGNIEPPPTAELVVSKRSRFN